MSKRKRPDTKARTIYKPEVVTQRTFRRIREQEVKTLMNVINTVAKHQGYRIKGRITFEHIQTGEVFK